jgi:hypothetical protein
MLLTLLLASASVHGGVGVSVNGLGDVTSGSFAVEVGDSIELSSGSDAPVDWLLVMPVRGTFWNGTGEGPHLGPVANLSYSVESLIGEDPDLRFTVGCTDGLPSRGTFYIARVPGWAPGDTLRAAEPLYDVFFGRVVQFAVRPDESYTGFLMELMGTPFIMAPRCTPAGRNQADCRLGSDCSGFAAYGKRRQGFDYRYLGPEGILPYLVPLAEDSFLPGPLNGMEGIYQSADGATVPTCGEGLRSGDIVHFGDQVSVFYEDRGVPGLLDSSDLLLQCWIGGPCLCTVAESGFADLPVRVYRWRDEVVDRSDFGDLEQRPPGKPGMEGASS